MRLFPQITEISKVNRMELKAMGRITGGGPLRAGGVDMMMMPDRRNVRNLKAEQTDTLTQQLGICSDCVLDWTLVV